MIEAEAHTDDHVISVAFDATAYFQQADANDIIQLAMQAWGGCMEADQVAVFMADKGAEYDERRQTLSALFRYLPGPFEDFSGFECHVAEEGAMAWLKEHRPDVWRQVRGHTR